MENEQITYIFADIEADGPIPGKHSMMSIGAVACTPEEQQLGIFHINLLPLPGAVKDQVTMDWWQTQPDAYKASIEDQRDAGEATKEFAAWVKSFPGKPILVAHPATFDYMWIAWYFQFFLSEWIFEQLSIDIRTYAMATLNWDFTKCTRKYYPNEWLGGHPHSHRAIQDALGYRNIFFELVRRNRILHSEKVTL